MRIAYIGLGNLGEHIAMNLLRAGHATTVTDLNRAAAASLLAAGGNALVRSMFLIGGGT